VGQIAEELGGGYTLVPSLPEFSVLPYKRQNYKVEFDFTTNTLKADKEIAKIAMEAFVGYSASGECLVFDSNILHKYGIFSDYESDEKYCRMKNGSIEPVWGNDAVQVCDIINEHIVKNKYGSLMNITTKSYVKEQDK